ncbi:MAG: thiamine ABC transporter substrate-binding protein [Euryarchaeota archaeon]|nr:thiamine ABC transporter substrate-binding protein [Euryarchaeota archaeon]
MVPRAFGRHRVFALALTALIALAGCIQTQPSGRQDPVELVVIAHDSFEMNGSLVEAFNATYNARVVILKAGDAGEALNKAIIAHRGGAPLGDLFYGVDNTLIGRALQEGVFEPYQPADSAKIPARLTLDPTFHATSVDYGYVNLNYDVAAIEASGTPLPADLKDLTLPAWKGKLAVIDPSVSSPGLAFLMSTVARFGETGDYTYVDFWRGLKENDVTVASGWEDVYYTRFSHYGGESQVVVSYATSPAAEAFFGGTPGSRPPTGSIDAPDSAFLQIEGIGILKGTTKAGLARNFVDFMLSPAVQEDMPQKNFVYPAVNGTELPAYFQWASEPEDPATLTSQEIDEGRDRWLEAWRDVMLA